MRLMALITASQQNFNDVDDDATQLPDPSHSLPAYNGADFKS